MDLARDKRALNRGFGDTLNRGFEFVVTMGVFGGIGFLLDRLVGSAPIFVVVLMVLAIVGQSARLWYGYDAEMRRHEAALPSAVAARAQRPPVPSVTRETIGLLRRLGRAVRRGRQP